MSEPTQTTDRPSAVTMRALNQRLKAIVETETQGKPVEVWGVATNLFRTSKGHVCFKLHQGMYSLSCIAFRNVARDLDFEIMEGQTLRVQGDVQVYARWGEFQINVQKIELDQDVPTGKKPVALMARAQAAGWLDPSRKRPVPRQPRRIGLIAGEKSRALQDVTGALQDAGITAPVTIEPVFMQGDDVAAHTLSALLALNADPTIDLIVIARGGGDQAELAAFNDENLAQAIVQSRVPVITAIGHRQDKSLADLVADLSVPTPSLVGSAFAEQPALVHPERPAPVGPEQHKPSTRRRDTMILAALAALFILLLITARALGWL